MCTAILCGKLCSFFTFVAAFIALESSRDVSRLLVLLPPLLLLLIVAAAVRLVSQGPAAAAVDAAAEPEVL